MEKTHLFDRPKDYNKFRNMYRSLRLTISNCVPNYLTPTEFIDDLDYYMYNHDVGRHGTYRSAYMDDICLSKLSTAVSYLNNLHYKNIDKSANKDSVNISMKFAYDLILKMYDLF